MIVEALCFGYELDMLEGRLETLADYVDLIVLVESDKTHTAKPKGYLFEDNRDRFSKWLHKIDYQKIDGWTTSNAWVNESNHRSSLRYYVEPHVTDNDLVIVCDVDEWWEPEHLSTFGPDVTIMNMSKRHFKVNWFDKMEYAGWAGHWSHIKNLNWYQHKISICEARTGGVPPGRVVDTGWHFSSVGPWQDVRRKIQSFSHSEFNNESMHNSILHCYENGHDLSGHRFTITAGDELPYWIRTNAPQSWWKENT